MTDLTEGRRLYAIGDVHGRLDLIEAMIARVRADLARRPHPAPRIVCLGDYVDRGPDSRGVIDALIEPARRRTCRRPSCSATTTATSRNTSPGPTGTTGPITGCIPRWAAPRRSPPTACRRRQRPEPRGDPRRLRRGAAARRTARSLRTASCGCGSAGTCSSMPASGRAFAMEEQTRDDCIWIREPFLSSTDDFGFKVVHGHTIVERVEHRANRIAIDTGVAKGGPLSCLVLEGDSGRAAGGGRAEAAAGRFRTRRTASRRVVGGR